jgi:UDP-glucose 4-epimerase
MRVLVTGVAGCLGRFLAADLARRGFDVVAVYRNRKPPPFAPPMPFLVQCDLSLGAGMPGRVDAVVHAAATSPAPGVTLDAIVHDNVEGTRRLLQYARSSGAEKFVFCSSLSIYGTVAGAEVDESTPIRDPDVYGMTKWIGEQLLAAAAPDLQGLVLRLPAVLGPGAQRNFIATAAARFLAGEPVTIFNPDAPFNNAAHGADISALVANVLRRGWSGFDAVVLGAAGRTTVRGAVELLRERLRSTSEIRVMPPTKPAFALRCARAVASYGYAPMNIGQMLERFADEVLAGSAGHS